MDAHYWASPAQTRTCGFPASGSSAPVNTIRITLWWSYRPEFEFTLSPSGFDRRKQVRPVFPRAHLWNSYEIAVRRISLYALSRWAAQHPHFFSICLPQGSADLVVGLLVLSCLPSSSLGTPGTAPPSLRTLVTFAPSFHHEELSPTSRGVSLLWGRMTAAAFVNPFGFTLRNSRPSEKEGYSSPKFRRKPLSTCPVLRRRVEWSMLAMTYLHWSAS